MPAKPDQPTTPRFRLDAVALTLFAAGGLLAVAVGSYRPLAGTENVLGGMGDEAAALLVDPLGWAVAVFLAGWFVLTGLLVVTRSPVRLAARLLGWMVLTACAAVAVDWFGAGLPQASAAGRGGSVGAYARFGLEDALDPLAAKLTFAAAVLLGLVLAADWLVRAVARVVWALLRALWKAAVWGNDRVAAGSEKVVSGLGTAANVVGRGATGIARTARAVSVPAAATAADAALPLAEAHEDIPIHVHTEHVPTPIALFRPDPPDDPPANADYELPPLTLLNDPDPFPVADHEQMLREVAALLEKTFKDFGMNVKVVGIHTGPVITQYEVALETGLRLNKVTRWPTTWR
jgi:DNA segregation ATPase FtsK/SpoIIIE, S-DNA-T family